jgi:hypothetical protein
MIGIYGFYTDSVKDIWRNRYIHTPAETYRPEIVYCSGSCFFSYASESSSDSEPPRRRRLLEPCRFRSGSFCPWLPNAMERAVVSGTPGNRLAENTVNFSVKVWASTGETSLWILCAPISGAGGAPTFIRRILSRNDPSVRTDKSWNRKKIPGFRCSSSRRQPFAERGPTSVRVYVCLGRGAAEAMACEGAGELGAG